MLRFNDSGKWNGATFCKFTPKQKLLWIWLYDHCNEHWMINFDEYQSVIASKDIGEFIGIGDVISLGDNMVWTDAISEGGTNVQLIYYKTKTPSAAIKSRVFERSRNKCQHCGSTKKLEIDHFIPRSLGGSNHIDNLQILCKSCNSAKRDRLIG